MAKRKKGRPLWKRMKRGAKKNRLPKSHPVWAYAYTLQEAVWAFNHGAITPFAYAIAWMQAAEVWQEYSGQRL